MRYPIYRALVLALGVLVLLSTQARSRDFGRQTIVQGVRDDVRRKIQDNERAAGPSAAHAYGRQWRHHAEPPHRR